MDLSFIQKSAAPTNVVCFVAKDGTLLGDAANAIDTSNGNFITNAMKVADFKTKFGQTLLLTAPTSAIQHVLLVSVGDKELEQVCLENLGGIVFSKLEKVCESATVLSENLQVKTCDDVAARIAYGAHLRSWHFDKYKTSEKCPNKLKSLEVISESPDKSSTSWNVLKNIADGVFFTRLLVSEPANVVYPESFANFVMQELLPLGVKVNVFDKAQLQNMGMGALLGVGQGSVNDPRLLVVQWEGSQDKPIAFVGKGITFDSGGIDLKPESGMEDMKHDMAGAATVVGLMKALALNKSKKNVVCVAALAENMPSGSAQKPGDIVKSMSGLTVEVLNTDAEGRLALADALWYTQKTFQPEIMIDLATLTGAIVVSLGYEYAGLFSNDDALSNGIRKAANITGEKIWRMPMDDYFDSTVESDIADLKNLTSRTVRGGSITAASFLKRFIGATKWAHIDIAGVATTLRTHDTTNVGATGYGVRLLYQLVNDIKPTQAASQKEQLVESVQKADSKAPQAPINGADNKSDAPKPAKK